MSLVPFDDRDGVIWFDGKLIPWRDAKLHVLTHAMHYAAAAFEGERAYGGVVFKSREHSERLHKSAELLGYKIPYSVDEIEKGKADVVKAMGGGDLYVRAIAWRGSEQMGVAAQQARIHLAIAAWAWPSYFSPDELGKTQEVFLVGTAAEVTPVGQIGEYKFSVGPVTKQLREDYLKEVRLPVSSRAAE